MIIAVEEDFDVFDGGKNEYAERTDQAEGKDALYKKDERFEGEIHNVFNGERDAPLLNNAWDKD